MSSSKMKVRLVKTAKKTPDMSERSAVEHEGKRQIERQEQSTDVIAQLLAMQHQLASAIYLPSPTVPVFEGNPLQYTTFMRSFDMRIASHVEGDADKLFYLDQQLKGEPKELIAGCLFMKAKDGYRKARCLLEKEYGDQYKISIGYVNRLLSWPKLKDEDPQGLKQLSVYLTKCLYAMESIHDMSILNHTPHLQCIVRILPDDLQQEWRDHVYELRKDNQHVSFKELAYFIEQLSDRYNHPAFGPDALNRVNERTTLSTSVQCHNLCIREIPKTTCPLCQRMHDNDDIEECDEFRKKDIEQKRAFLRQTFRCFSCYGSNHVSRNCLNKRTCQKCQKPHPTSMHDDKFRLNK